MLLAPMRAIRIGITGKLGSGKSTLAKMMEVRGTVAVRSDGLARELMERDPALRAKLTQILGQQAFAQDTLDRKFVASRIFSDRTVRKQVEAVIHPGVTAELERSFEAHPNEMVAVESALILQTCFRERFDYIILIESPDEEAIARVTQEGRMSKADAEVRLAVQVEDRLSSKREGGKTSFEAKCVLFYVI